MVLKKILWWWCCVSSFPESGTCGQGLCPFSELVCDDGFCAATVARHYRRKWRFCATYSRRKWKKRGKLRGKQRKIWQTEKNEDGQKNGKCQLAAAASRGKRKFLENYSTKNCETEKNEDGQQKIVRQRKTRMDKKLNLVPFLLSKSVSRHDKEFHMLPPASALRSNSSLPSFASSFLRHIQSFHASTERWQLLKPSRCLLSADGSLSPCQSTSSVWVEGKQWPRGSAPWSSPENPWNPHFKLFKF